MRVKRKRETAIWQSSKEREVANPNDCMPTNSLRLPTRRSLLFKSLNLLLLLHTKSTNNNKHSDQEEENYCAAEWNCKSKSWIKMASQPKTETTPTTAAAKADRQGVCRECVCVLCVCVYTWVWVCLLVYVCVCMCFNSKNKPKCIIIIWITKYTHIFICLCSYIQYNKWGFCVCVCVPRPANVVAPQGRRLRIARGGSGLYRLHCLILCGCLCTESEILPHPLSYPAGMHSP